MDAVTWEVPVLVAVCMSIVPAFALVVQMSCWNAFLLKCTPVDKCRGSEEPRQGMQDC